MNKAMPWLIRIVVPIVIGVCLIIYINIQRTPSALSKRNIENLRYKELDKKRTNLEFAAERDALDYEKFGSKISCNPSLNSWIESVNYS